MDFGPDTSFTIPLWTASSAVCEDETLLESEILLGCILTSKPSFKSSSELSSNVTADFVKRTDGEFSVGKLDSEMEENFLFCLD